MVGMWLGECCRQVETEEASKSSNKVHQTTYQPLFLALYIGKRLFLLTSQLCEGRFRTEHGEQHHLSRITTLQKGDLFPSQEGGWRSAPRQAKFATADCAVQNVETERKLLMCVNAANSFGPLVGRPRPRPFHLPC